MSDRLVSRFHLCHSGLTRSEALRHLGLRKSQPLAPSTQARGECQLRFDEPALLGRQVEKVACIADDPSRSFEPPLLLLSTALRSLLARKADVGLQPPSAVSDHGPGRRGGLLAEYLKDHNRIIGDVIHDPPRLIALPNPQFVAPWSDAWHWP